MGLTPLEGLVMGRRCGDVDPGLVLTLIREGRSPDEVEMILGKRSGLAGLAEGLGPVAPLGLIDTALGSPRWRTDAVLVPSRWFRQDEIGIELDADLELARYVPGRCHLHLLGRVTLPDGMEPRTPASSLYGRQAVAIVRGALTGLADELATRASITAA